MAAQHDRFGGIKWGAAFFGWLSANGLAVLLVAAIAGLGFVSEMVMERWSGIYLRDSLGLGALLGGSGVAVFFGAMALGRFGTGWAVTRLGNRRVLLGAGVLTACGMALALVTTLPAATPPTVKSMLLLLMPMQRPVPSVSGWQKVTRIVGAVWP